MTDKRGVTLVSVIVAAAILAMALGMAVSAFYSSARLTKQSVSFTKASNFAEGIMERTVAMPYSQIKSTKITSNTPKLQDFACVVDVTKRESLKEITVRCSWTAGKLPREIKLSTLVAKGERR
ncbi:MAG: prepilin-type N-terminal cleavage/methylation domain-containing protein [Armatimonadetes bacterium]|nr:prepilin-type N-terminal cleavage/methylation domain-containing protein [Armatimonadota bacterium]